MLPCHEIFFGTLFLPLLLGHSAETVLKWYYDLKKNTLKLCFNFEKTVYLNYSFPIQWPAIEHSLLIMQNMPYGFFSVQHGSFELSDSQTRVLHN